MANCNRVFRGLAKFWRILISLALMQLVIIARQSVLGIQLPVGLTNFDFNSLPVYCKGSTRHFECKDDKGGIHCLPVSLQCRIQCANEAEFNCPNTAANCTVGQYRCQVRRKESDTAQQQQQLFCLQDELLCDGRVHCPGGDDESAEMCQSRTCPPGRFACRSAGHCIPSGRRCDGHADCTRPGLDDRSDEAACPSAMSPGCPDAFRCVDGSGCVSRTYLCDGFADCADSSDESATACGPREACGPAEIDCDGRCLPADRLRCDGRVDCLNGFDERDCPAHPDQQSAGHTAAPGCPFTTDFHCRTSSDCVPRIFLCDGVDDCNGSGEDEICPVEASKVCARPDYWICASGTHCLPSALRCNSVPDCPDASDEVGCPVSNQTVVSTSAPIAATAMTNPRPTASESDLCRFGRCSQVCDQQSGRCDCLAGYRLAPGNATGSCVANGAGKLMVLTPEGVIVADLETQRAVTVIEDLGAFGHVAAVDAAEGTLMFVNSRGRLRRVGLKSGGSGVVRDDLGGGFKDVFDMSYDWTRKLLFYSSPSTGVGVVDAVRGWRTVLRVLDCPGGLDVDPKNADLYVALCCGQRPGIYRMSQNGRDLRPVLYASDTAGHPARLRLDLTQSPPRIYWTDATQPGVFSARLDGRDVRSHALATPAAPVAARLAVFEENVFLQSANGSAILLIDKFATDSVPRKRFELSAAMSGRRKANIGGTFLVQHTALQPPQVNPNSTSMKCHACQQICLSGASDEVATCLCDQHFRMTDLRTGRCEPIVRVWYPGAFEDKDEVAEPAPQDDVSIPSNTLPTELAPLTPSRAQLGAAIAAACLSLLAMTCALACTIIYCRHKRRKQSVQLAEESPLKPGSFKKGKDNAADGILTADSSTPLNTNTVENEVV